MPGRSRRSELDLPSFLTFLSKTLDSEFMFLVCGCRGRQPGGAADRVAEDPATCFSFQKNRRKKSFRPGDSIFI